MNYLLGTHKPGWLATAHVPLMVSARRLRERVRLPRAASPWALDSGAFTELKNHGRWTVGPKVYADEARRWRDGVGALLWCACQDWMCEPVVIRGGKVGRETFVGAGLSVREHQRRTTLSYLTLCELAPDIPWLPVLQGWEHDDYLRHLEDYRAAGIDLAALPLVGLGSVCRRQDTDTAEQLIRHLCRLGLKVHAFAFKLEGLRRAARWLASADSMAWSFDARHSDPMPGCVHKSCANCIRYALHWRRRVLDSVQRAQGPTQSLLWED